MNELRSPSVLDIMPHQHAVRTIFLTSLTVQLLAGLQAGCALVAPIESHGTSTAPAEGVRIVLSPPLSAPDDTSDLDAGPSDMWPEAQAGDDGGFVADGAARDVASDVRAPSCHFPPDASACPPEHGSLLQCDGPLSRATCVDGGVSNGTYRYCC